MNRTDIGRLGVSITAEGGGHRERAADLERRGVATLWVTGGQLASLDLLTDLIDATTDVTVGSSIAMIDRFDADAVASAHHQGRGRLIAGIGGAHGGRQQTRFSSYFDRLDESGVPKEHRLLAALGPRKLALARERSAGAIVLLLTPEHTAWVRQQLGPDAVLIVQQLIAVEDDPDLARGALRETVGFLADLPGYGASLRRMGFTDDDITTRSDRLVDGVTGWGSVDRVAAGLRAHLDAGADQVMIDEAAFAAGIDNRRLGG